MTGVLFEARAARTHTPADPLKYSWGNEHRDINELKKMCDQLMGKPMTLLHPDDLISRGAQANVIGKVIGSKIDDDTAVIQFLVDDEEGLKALMEHEATEVSVGYMAATDENGYQHNTVVDHCAIVPRGRGGKDLSVRTDEAFLAKARAGDDTEKLDNDLNAKERKGISGGDFADPDQRKLPIENEAHVRAAMSLFSQTQFSSDSVKAEAKRRIISKAHSFGIDTSGFEKAHGDAVDVTCQEVISCNTNAMSDLVTEQLQTKLAEALAEATAQKVRADHAEKVLAETESAKRLIETNAAKDAEVAATSLAAEKVRADKAESDAKDAVAKAHTDAKEFTTKALQEHVAVLYEADRIIGQADRSALSVRDLKVAIIKHVDGDDVAATEDASYVQGMYKGAIKRFDAVKGSVADVRGTVNAARNDATNSVTLTGLAAEKAASQAQWSALSTNWMTDGAKE